MDLKDLAEMPRISIYVKNRFIGAVKKHHEGAKWRVLKQETEKALLYYIEVGPLSDELYIANKTTGDVEKVKLTIPEFFKIFDNEHVYVYDKIDTEYLKNIVTNITDNESEYNWRKWSKIIKQSGRIKQLKGTPYYQVNRAKFEFISDELRASFDLAIQERHKYNHNNVMEDHANRIYKKLTLGGKTSLNEICNLGSISEKEGKKVIDKLVEESKLRLVNRGVWKVLDHNN